MNWQTRLLTVLSVLLVCTLQSQEDFVDAIRWANPFEADRSFEFKEVLTLSDASASLIGANDDGLFNFKFSRDGQFLGTEKLIHSESDLYGYISRGDSLYVVHSNQESGRRRIEILLFNLTASNSAEVLQRFETEFSVIPKSKNRLVWSISPDGKQWMISQKARFVKSRGSRIEIQTYNLDSNMTDSLELTLPYDSDDLKYIDGLISNTGSIFISGQTGIQLNSPFRRKYLLFSYFPTDKELREFDLNPKDHYLQSIEMRQNKFGVTAISLYSTDPFADSETNGFLMTKFDPTGKNVKTKYVQPYNAEAIKQNEIEGSVGSPNSIQDFFLQDLVEANEWYAIFEKQFLDQTCTTDPRTGIMNCTDQHNFLGLTIVNLSSPGTSSYIDRKQIDFNSIGDHSSNVSLPMNSKLLVLYNDHFKNEGMRAERVMNNGNRSAIRAMVVGKNLELATYKLTEERQNDFVFMSSIHYKSNLESGVYILAHDGKELRLGFLDYSKIN